MLNRRQSIWGGTVSMALGALSSGASASGETGTWSAVLEIGALRLRLKLDIEDNGIATLFSVDQGREQRPGRLASSPDGKIEIEFATIGARYVGRVVSPDRMDGTFHQGGASFPLVFQRGEAALGPLPPIRPLDQARLGELRRQADAPAMAAACMRKGSSPKFWVDGERQLGSGIAARETDLWHIGSITKSMTATLVARLVEDGALRWNDTVGDVLGSTAPDMNEAYRRATFRHLVSHRAGLQANIEMADALKFSRDTDDARADRKAYARLALGQSPKGPMETTYEYSNAGYVIAGAMIEARLGSRWEDLIRSRLFEPLGLASAGFGAPGHAGATEQPVGHARSGPGGALQAYPPGGPITDNPVVIGPAGRVHINLADLLRYLAAHRDGNELLKPESWRILHTPPFGGGYAMGWIVFPNGALSHGGSNTLWYAEVRVDRAAGVVAAAAANDGDLARVTPAVGHAILEAASTA
jgi:CubicO group peptidase (beta-lactamase class C family)